MMAATIRPLDSPQLNRLHPVATTGTRIFQCRTMGHFKNSAVPSNHKYLGFEAQWGVPWPRILELCWWA
jgi:hypothetical protein